MYSQDPDEFLREIAQEAGVTPSEFLTALKERAKSSDAHADCLQPHEWENAFRLSKERLAHVKACVFCQVLLNGAVPNEEAARRFAAEAVLVGE